MQYHDVAPLTEEADPYVASFHLPVITNKQNIGNYASHLEHIVQSTELFQHCVSTLQLTRFHYILMLIMLSAYLALDSTTGRL